MQKPWLEQYPEGVPYEVGALAFGSLAQMLEESCERFSQLPAFSNMGVAMTYNELGLRTRDFAAYLQQRERMRPGERIGIIMPNLLQYPIALFGALRAGLIAVSCNPLFTAKELEYQLKDSGATGVVVLENMAHTLQEVIGKTAVRTVIVTGIGDLFPAVKASVTNFIVRHVRRMVKTWRIGGAVEFKTVLEEGSRLPLDPVRLSADDIALLQYTGGTTGTPKGVMLTHANVVANVQQISAWVGNTLEEGAETVVTALPLYHVFALTINLFTFVKWGGHDVLITDPRNVPRFVRELRKLRFTIITGVDTLFKILLRDAGIRRVDLSALKVAVAGGMALQHSTADDWLELTGTPLIEGYGLTEASPLVAANRLDTREYSGAVGLPIPSTEVVFRDEEGRELPLGQIGELCVRGPQVMKGYWNRPEETASVLDADGWLRTGDMGFMDERGYIRVTDRKKDMIVVSGFKVFPKEIEDVVARHPGVLDVAAIGAPNDISGEVVKIVVVRKDPALTGNELIAHCEKELTGYKVPKIVEFRNEPLPKSAIGKPLRRLLRT